MKKTILFCIVFTALFIFFSLFKNLLPSSYERLAHGLIGTFTAFVVTYFFLRHDKKRFSDIELVLNNKTVPNFFLGLIIGIILMGSLATGVMYFTNVEIQSNPSVSKFQFFLMTLPLMPLAFMEELGFRAYPLQMLKRNYSIILSVVITSLLFALYHIANGWSVTSSFYGPGVWGLLFGGAAVYSKGIALPTGIHYALNLTTSAFGESDSKVALWVVKQTAGSSSIYKGIDLAIVLPSIIVFLVGAFGLFWLYKNETHEIKKIK